MSTETENYYRALDLESGASLEEVKQSWRVLVKVWHPDRFPDDLKMQHRAGEKLKEINQAYEELKKNLAVPNSPPPHQAHSTRPPPKTNSTPRPQQNHSSGTNNLRMVCNECGGQVEFPNESEGATVPCPHCGRNILLYRSNHAFNPNSKRSYEDIVQEPKPKSSVDEFFEGLAGVQSVEAFDKNTSLTGNQIEDVLVVGVLVICLVAGIGIAVAQIHGWLFDVILCSLPIYLLPTYLAKRHKISDAPSIFMLNFFTGWSIVGWVIALVWARKEIVAKLKSQPQTPPKEVPRWQKVIGGSFILALIILRLCQFFFRDK